MAWDDPSPRTLARPAAALPSSQPGYTDEPAAFGRRAFCLLAAGIAGVSTALATRHGLAGWRGHAAHPSGLDFVLSAVLGFAVALLAWKTLANRPGGGGWLLRLGRRRSWATRYDDAGFGDVDVAEVVADLIGDAIDAAID